MNMKIFYLLFISLFLFVVPKVSINTTKLDTIISLEASLLIGTPTSRFPREAFINFILYGHADVPFSYKDFLTSYEPISPYFSSGYFIIGNDCQLVGIVIDYDVVAIPVPNGNVITIPYSQLPKYFPKSYSIFKTQDTIKHRAEGFAQASFNNNMICSDYNCTSDIYSIDNNESLFIDNNYLMIGIYSQDLVYQVVSYSYLSSMNLDNRKGIITVSSYYVATGKSSIDAMANESYPNNTSILCL